MKFDGKEFIIGANEWNLNPLRFSKFITIAGTSTPTYREVILSGVSPLALVNAKADGLNYLKLFGDTEQLPETYIDSVTADGKCIQRNLPEGYTQVNGVTNVSVSSVRGYIDTGIVADVDDMEYDIVAKVNNNDSASWYLLQSRGSSNAPIYGISGSQTGNTIICGFCGGSVQAPTIIRQADHTYHVNFKCKNGNATLFVEDLTAGMSETTTGTYTFTAATTNTGLFSNINGGGQTLFSENTSVLSAYIKKSGVKVMDYVSCKDSNSTAGFYDKATSTFIGATVGDMSAGSDTVPTPDTPMDIVCNNGTIKARMVSGLPLGYTKVAYIGSDSTAYIDTGIAGGNNNLEIGIEFEYGTHVNYGGVFGNWVSDGDDATRCIIADTQDFVFVNHNNKAGYPSTIRCTRGTKHTVILNHTTISVDGTVSDLVNTSVTGTANNGNIALLNRSLTNPNTERDIALKVYSWYVKDNGVLVQNLIPCKRNSDNVLGMYDTVSGNFLTNAGTGTFTAGSDDDSLQIYTDGTTETITDNVGNVASCQNLLSVGTYKDTQEILSGAVTRNVGIKVFDGTENWEDYATGSGYAVTISDMISSKRGNYYCSHARAVTGIADFGIAFGSSSGNNKIYWCQITSLFATLTAFKQYLSDQYANGTPVIVVYPLDTATTESVTGQVLNKSPVTASGSISGLVATAVTSSHTTPTPTQPLQINCNNGVVKLNNLWDGGTFTNTTSTDTRTSLLLQFQEINSPYTTTWRLENAPTGQITATITISESGKAWRLKHNGSARDITIYNFGDLNAGTYVLSMYVESNDVTTAGGLKIKNGLLVPMANQITVDGTTETVNVHTKNLLNISADSPNKYWSATGTEEELYVDGVYFVHSDYIPVKPNTTYTVSGTRIATGNATIYAASYFDANKQFVSRNATTEPVFTNNTYDIKYTTPANAVYMSVNHKANDVNMQIEKGSTATTYEAYYNGGSATAQDLYAVGTYKDVQSILDGAVTRNVGIKVLDGSEDISIFTGTTSVFLVHISDTGGAGNGNPINSLYCTHFKPSSSLYTASMQNNSIYERGDSNLDFFIKCDSYGNNLQGFTNWLTDQYAAGTPVIIIYPLATPTTESVTAQSLTTQQGDNVVEITQASMDGLTMEISYMAGVTVTVTEVENAQLSNNVEVTIS